MVHKWAEAFPEFEGFYFRRFQRGTRNGLQFQQAVFKAVALPTELTRHSQINPASVAGQLSLLHACCIFQSNQPANPIQTPPSFRRKPSLCPGQNPTYKRELGRAPSRRLQTEREPQDCCPACDKADMGNLVPAGNFAASCSSDYQPSWAACGVSEKTQNNRSKVVIESPLWAGCGFRLYEFEGCWRRLNPDRECRSNFDRGLVASI